MPDDLAVYVHPAVGRKGDASGFAFGVLNRQSIFRCGRNFLFRKQLNAHSSLFSPGCKSQRFGLSTDGTIREDLESLRFDMLSVCCFRSQNTCSAGGFEADPGFRESFQMRHAQVGITREINSAFRPGIHRGLCPLKRHADRRFFRSDISPDIHGHAVGQKCGIGIQISLHIQQKVSIFDLERIERQVRDGSKDRAAFREDFHGFRCIQDQLILKLNGHGDRVAVFAIHVGDVLRKSFLQNVDRAFVERMEVRPGFNDERIFQPADRLIRFQKDLSAGNDGRHRDLGRSLFSVGLKRKEIFQFRKFAQ